MKDNKEIILHNVFNKETRTFARTEEAELANSQTSTSLTRQHADQMAFQRKIANTNEKIFLLVQVVDAAINVHVEPAS